MGSLNRRKDTNFFDRFDVSSTSFSDHKISWNFTSQGIALLIYSDEPTDVVQYSFDGETIHGDMVPRTPSEAIIFDGRHQSKIWFRRAAPGAAVSVRVEAWRSDA